MICRACSALRFCFHICVANTIRQVADTHSAPHPITKDNVEDILASSTADFCVLITDHDIAKHTVQACVAGQYVEMEVEKRATSILESWASTIQCHNKPHYHVSVGMNPNVVTSKHIDFLLQQHPSLRGIRAAYAALARLVDSTQHWLAAPEQTQHENEQRQPLGHDPRPQPQTRSHALPRHQIPSDDQSQSDSHDALNVHLDDNNDAGVSTRRQHAASHDMPSAAPAKDALREQQSDAETPGQPAPVASSRDTTPSISAEQMEKLAKKALRYGVDSVIKHNTATDAQRKKDLDVLQQPALTIRWLKRSHNISAQVLRSQFLVRSLHERLLETFSTIASAPVAPHNDHSYPNVASLPSEAHRQRMLRELNFLLPRMEELGARLSRRPRTRRRSRVSTGVNPWMAYVEATRASTKTAYGIAGISGYAHVLQQNGGWRCTGCHSMNERSQSSCSSCQAPSCVLERGLLPEASEAFGNRVREAITAAAAEPRPWIFAPAPMPMAPTPSGGPPVINASGIRQKSPPYVAVAPPQTPAEPLVGTALAQDGACPVPQREASFELAEALQAATLDDPTASARGGESRFFDLMRPGVDSMRMGLGAVGAPPPMPFHMPNGGGMGAAGGVPIARSPLRFDSSPPILSPTDVEYHPFRSTPIESARAAPADPNLLGQSLDRRPPNHWFAEGYSSADSTLAQRPQNASSFHEDSPPLFNGSNSLGFNGAKATGFDSLNMPKASGPRDVPITVNGRANLHVRNYQHFSSHSQVTAPNGALPIHVGQTGTPMEELAVGSIDAHDLPSRYLGAKARVASTPIAVPGANEQRSSLEALAAASDAANGGIGSATRESIRVVSAVLTESDNAVESQQGDRTRAYMMF